MVFFRTTLLALAGAVAVSAQSDYWVEPDSVPLQDRMAWCNSQISMCEPICLESSTGKPEVNTCDPKSLTYGCVCSNGKQPNMTEYTLTLPYYVCTAWGTQCVAACAGDNQCASSCREDHPCGAQSPKRVNQTSSATAGPTATSSSAVADAAHTGFAGSEDGSDGSNKGHNAAGALRFGDSYGLAVVAGGLFAGVAMLL